MSFIVDMKGGYWGSGSVMLDKTMFGRVKGVRIVPKLFSKHKQEFIPVDKIASVSLVSEDNKGSGVAAAGGAVAGALLLGPLGLLGGLIAGAAVGGHKKAGAILTHVDGRQAVLFSDTQDILELIGCAGQNE